MGIWTLLARSAEEKILDNFGPKNWNLDLWEGGLGGVFSGPTPRGGGLGHPPLLPPHP